jgi:hypothetical protein
MLYGKSSFNLTISTNFLVARVSQGYVCTVYKNGEMFLFSRAALIGIWTIRVDFRQRGSVC